MDAQLENVSPERASSSFQNSLGRHSFHVIQATPHKSGHISENIPSTLQYRTPRLEEASMSQNTKRRKAEDYSAASTPMAPSKRVSPTHFNSKRVSTLGIDMLGQMWLGFYMQEVFLTQRGKRELKYNRSDEDFLAIGTPATEVHEFRSICRAFPRTAQVLYPTKRPDAVPGQYLHFTQIPKYEHISQATGFTEGFHVTIRFDGKYTSLIGDNLKPYV